MTPRAIDPGMRISQRFVSVPIDAQASRAASSTRWPSPKLFGATEHVAV